MLFDEPITGERALKLEIPAPGWLVVAFTNDLHRPPDDRNLRLDEVNLHPMAAL